MTKAHRDPTMTTFLSLWVYEEFWHGEAIAKVLELHGEPAGADRIAPMRRRVASPARLLRSSRRACPRAGDALTATQVTWGVVNEWTTQAGYARLAERAATPCSASS
ncbi:MAG: hypothetical protein R2715_22025 [Ilumatobacteraceae bacterium]